MIFRRYFLVVLLTFPFVASAQLFRPLKVLIQNRLCMILTVLFSLLRIEIGTFLFDGKIAQKGLTLCHGWSLLTSQAIWPSMISED